MGIEINLSTWFSRMYSFNYINEACEMIKMTVTQNDTFHVIKIYPQNIGILDYTIFSYTGIKEKEMVIIFGICISIILADTN